MKPSGPGLLFAGRFLITVSLPLLFSVSLLQECNDRNNKIIIRATILLIEKERESLFQ